MEIKKFRNKYGLELIPASHEGIILGTLVWDPVVGKPSFDHPGMPDHIFNAFLDAEIMHMEEWETALKEFRESELKEANIAESVVKINVDVVSSLGQIGLGAIEGYFELKSIKKFTFGEINVRFFSPLQRIQIDDYLEILKKDHWELYDGKIRRVFIISELYYGSVKIVIDKALKSNLSGAIENAGLEAKNVLELGNAVEYSFDHRNVPFAMKLELVRGFTS
jgi:hypothetical protein